MDTNKKFIIDKSDLESAQLPLDELFSLQVNYNDVIYEFLIRFSSKNKNLICTGSGAYNPLKISPPIYSRHSWQSEFEESVIYYNDPTLYNTPELFLGWGIGKNDEWYLSVISDIIQILALKNDIKSEDILFFGSSGGGFTSIILSTIIKNSAAIVNNPQMLCKNYLNFEFIVKSCFDNLDLETILAQYSHRFDVVEMFKREKYMPDITYAANVNSKVDLDDQLIPFINSIASLENFDYRVKMILYQNDNGHVGVLNKKETLKLIKNHFKQDNLDKIKSLEKNSNHMKAQLKLIANTKPYRIAYALRRFSQEFLKGDNKSKKDFLKWIYHKITKKDYESDHKYNPIMEIVKK